MAVLRWILAAAGIALWGMAAWANGEIVFGRRYRDAEQRPSFAYYVGGLFAALGLWAIPLHGPRVFRVCLGAWVVMGLLDIGTLGYLVLPLFIRAKAPERKED